MGKVWLCGVRFPLRERDGDVAVMPNHWQAPRLCEGAQRAKVALPRIRGSNRLHGKRYEFMINGQAVEFRLNPLDDDVTPS